MTALAAAAAPSVPRGMGRLADVPVDLIDIADNIRTDVGDLSELVASVRELGLLQPITVVRTGERFRLAYGQRRLLAYREIGWPRIPAIIVPADTIEERRAGWRETEQLVENLQRSDLNALEEAHALRAILDADPDLTQAALAKRLGRSAPWVSNTLRILELAPPVMELVAAGTLSASHAKVLAGVPVGRQEYVADNAVKRRLSAHELEEQAQWLSGQADRVATQAAHQRESSEKAIKAAVASLAKKGALSREPITVIGHDTAAYAKALKAAGYTSVKEASGYIPPAPGPKWCDCRAWQVSPGYSSTVGRMCIDPAHGKAAAKADEAKYSAKNAAQRADVEAAQAAVLASIEAHPLDRTLAEILLWQLLGTWQRDEWAKGRKAPGVKGKADAWATIRALPDAELMAEVAGRIAPHDAPPMATVEASA